jgi:hypothetical protein
MFILTIFIKFDPYSQVVGVVLSWAMLNEMPKNKISAYLDQSKHINL